MKSDTYRKQFKKSFFRVDEWGRSSFRLLLVGLCFLLVWWVSATLGMPVGAFRAIRSFGVLGVIFVIYAVIGPGLELVIRKIAEKRKSE